MPFDGSGTFAVYTPGTPYVNGTTIDETVVNAVQSDFATGLTNCVTRDGQSPATANLPMGSFRHTGVGNATTRAAKCYASAADVQDGTFTYLTGVAGTNTITATAAISMTAYASGQRFAFIPANTNTGATTVNLNSIGAKDIFWNGAACVGGELRQNVPAVVIYDGTQFHIIANGFNVPFLDSHAIAEGSSDSTKKVRLEVDGLTTATTRVLTVADNDGTILTTGNGQATQADQETGSSTTTYVTPGRQQYHPSAAKAWAKYAGTTVSASYNVSSVTSNGTGDKNVNFTTAFSTADYCSVASAIQTFSGVGTPSYCVIVSQSTTAVRVATGNRDAGTQSGTDSTTFVACFGDQ